MPDDESFIVLFNEWLTAQIPDDDEEEEEQIDVPAEEEEGAADNDDDEQSIYQKKKDLLLECLRLRLPDLADESDIILEISAILAMLEKMHYNLSEINNENWQKIVDAAGVANYDELLESVSSEQSEDLIKFKEWWDSQFPYLQA